MHYFSKRSYIGDMTGFISASSYSDTAVQVSMKFGIREYILKFAERI